MKVRYIVVSVAIIIIVYLIYSWNRIEIKTFFNHGVTNVTWFNNNDNTADNIQEALDYAKRKGSVKLYFPAGQYKVNKALSLYQNTTLIFDKRATLIRTGEQIVMFMNAGQDKGYKQRGKYDGEGNIHIIGGNFDFNIKNLPMDKSNFFVNINHANNVSIKGAKFYNFQAGHAIQIASSKNIRIENNEFCDQFINYSHYRLLDETIQIEVANKVSFPSYGLYDDTISKNITIRGNRFKNVIRGVGTHGIARDKNGNILKSQNITIENNVFEDIKDTAISLSGYDNVIVKNNDIDKNRKDAISMNGVDYSRILNNTITGSGEKGIYMKDSNFNMIRNNRLENGNQSIYRLNSQFNVITDNTRVTKEPVPDLLPDSDGANFYARLDSNKNQYQAFL
ncbi:parallel beta-helix repeat protein [Scopulibacillus daqui]|uniref:Parallel beta-helix repeat protein n=1 Tax=Scopulibacillus daqui TaxID=1469162 RepID=A0ABS2Q0S2_9BACL|nr:right-handed parallel beta-helix repeat-containing protein [Scopulibacillus daqui]MBM7645890.1 parallel beta-helix repeat protein [Scopulibacillus daqui]